jgi:hypothetical protein
MDRYEETIEEMLRDLALNDAMPESIRILNEATIEHLLAHPELLAPGVFTRALLRSLSEDS